MCFLVAGLQFFTSVLFVADWYLTQNAFWLIFGAIFVAIGGMLVSIGASEKKKEANDQDMRRV